MTSSTPSSTTTTTNSSPWAGEIPDIDRGLANANAIYSSTGQMGPSYYPGQTYASLNPAEDNSINNMEVTGNNGTSALQNANNGVSTVASGAFLQPSVSTFDQSQNTLSGLMSNLNPSSNPYLQQAEANTTAATLPAIQAQAAAGGRADSGEANYAQSQGLASALGGLNYGQYNTNATNALAATGQTGTNYNSGVTDVNQSGLVAPGLNNATLTGEQTAFGAGQATQTDQQNQIQALMNKYNYQQMQPYNALSLFEGDVSGSGATGGTTTETSPYYTNNFANVGAGLAGIGGLASGLSSAGLFSGNGLLSAASLGALFPFSDRRLKEDIRKVGKAENGLAIYAYRLLGDPKTQIGFMADEVAKKHPGAVIDHPSGFKMVDYDRAARP